MSTTSSILIPTTVLGQTFSLMASYEANEGLLFVLDISEALPSPQDFKTLSQEDQKLLKDNFEPSKELQEELDKFESKPEDQDKTWKERLTQVFHHVHFNNIAFYWDKKAQKSHFFLDLIIELEEALSSKDGNLALEFISLDLVLSSGDKALTAAERATKKQEIADAKRALLRQGKLQKNLSQVANKYHQFDQQLASILHNSQKNNATLEKVQRQFNAAQQKVEQEIAQWGKKQTDEKQSIADCAVRKLDASSVVDKRTSLEIESRKGKIVLSVLQ